ncbi:MAG: hypothetical protein H6551_03920 [Chitinophagales bacterium]|nr:hypothetical protein [Chitinophagales bacterium]
MQRIPTLLSKIQELSNKRDITEIDVDLMLDYTRVMYADLLELKKQTGGASVPPVKNTPRPVINLAEDDTPSAVVEEVKAQPFESAINNKDIRTYIGINDKYLYINELFDDDKSEYDSVIKRINAFNSFDEAESWLNDNISIKNNWDGDDETVMSFYELLNSFFSER